jgi:hypothetical protein
MGCRSRGGKNLKVDLKVDLKVGIPKAGRA